MAYRVPTFNLLCRFGASSAGAGAWPPSLPALWRLDSVPCALIYGRRVNQATSGGTADQGFPTLCMNLVVAKLTDIRAIQSADQTPDAVEVPIGSGRFYGVAAVDDIGKGWPNEHRVAALQAIPGTWVVPYG